MKTIKDLNLKHKDKKKVTEWLNEWLQMLIKNANGREGTVYRANFENQDFFYFTDCTDILSKDPEARGVEHNRAIQIRKRVIMTQLLIKSLLGEVLIKKQKCSHCGYPDRYIDALPNGGGHILYCPKCFYTNICTYPAFFDTCVDNTKDIIKTRFGHIFVKNEDKIATDNEIEIKLDEKKKLKSNNHNKNGNCKKYQPLPNLSLIKTLGEISCKKTK